MSRLKKRISILGIIFGTLLMLSVWFYHMVVYNPPFLPKKSVDREDLKKVGTDHYVLGENWLRKNKNGNWESYIEGDPYERGQVIGILHSELVKRQEEAFIAEINRNIPSWLFRKMILLGIAWFNKDLDDYIPLEYLQEIYGISEHFSDDYNHIGPKYNRILNYHAAHDIGHAVQNMRLVGCTAFGTWEFNDSTSKMIMGRNFDFFFGDEFAKEKIVLLVNPDQGHKYLSVTWGGFCGIVSGMNEKGLGITLNSDKSEIPTTAGTPVSIVARDILQYAGNIEEALAIAEKYQTFVSESFTISSAADRCAVVLEKTPKKSGVYAPVDNSIIVTNHFQSDSLKGLPINIQHLEESESLDRYGRTKELVSQIKESSPESIAHILRDQYGINGENIGISNPKAINQLLAHHAIIFKNLERLVWVSNYPFQESVFDAYDLDDYSRWTTSNVTFPISIDSLEIGSDPFYNSLEYESFEKFKSLKKEILLATGAKVMLSEEVIEKFIKSNPEYYDSYRIAADYDFANEKEELARKNYNTALTKNIAYLTDREYISAQLIQIKK